MSSNRPSGKMGPRALTRSGPVAQEDQAPVRAIGYLRVSTDEQRESGLGQSAQHAAVAADCARRGWDVTFFEDAGYSARTLKRPGIQGALDTLARGEADALVVSRLDRLSRSMLDFTALMARAQ